MTLPPSKCLIASNVAVLLAANDTVELQGNFTGDDGFFVADHTRFWGFKLT